MPATANRKGGKKRVDRRREMILAALASLPATTTLAALAGVLGEPAGSLAPDVERMVRGETLESWPDADWPGAAVLMLSDRAVRKLGLSLSRDGTHWRDRDGCRPLPPANRGRGRPRKDRR